MRIFTAVRSVLLSVIAILSLPHDAHSGDVEFELRKARRDAEYQQMQQQGAARAAALRQIGRPTGMLYMQPRTYYVAPNFSKRLPGFYIHQYGNTFYRW